MGVEKYEKKRFMSLCLSIIILIGIVPLGMVNATAQTETLGELCLYPEFDNRIQRDYMYSVTVAGNNGTALLLSQICTQWMLRTRHILYLLRIMQHILPFRVTVE